MFDNLSERLERSFKILKGEGKITEINVAESLKDVRKALMEADVNYKVAKSFIDEVKEKAMGQNVLTAVKPREMMIKIVNDELTELMGGTVSELNYEGKPGVILMAGLNGAGKTTLSGKLALFLKDKQHQKPLLVACDVYRPAAIDQLKVIGEQIGVEVYSEPDNKDAVAIAQNGIQYAKGKNYTVVIVDTAGRLSVDEELMKEIAAIKEAIQPTETLFVVDAMTGQDAVNTAKDFNDRLDYDGVVLTKLDGDTRGGAAISIRKVVNKPIKLIGIGEKMDALSVFYPDRMANRILGMGDVITLVERAQQAFEENKNKKRKNSLRDFTYETMMENSKTIDKIGNLSEIASMIPGMSKYSKDLEGIDLYKTEKVMYNSMTPYERSHPEVLKADRLKRIAAGCGIPFQVVQKKHAEFMKLRKVFGTLSKMDRRQISSMMNDISNMAKNNKL